MSAESCYRTKIELRKEKPKSVVDFDTGQTVLVPCGVDWQLELLRTFKSALVDISNYNSITVEVQASQSRTAANLMTKTLAFGSFNLTPSLNDWKAGVEGANSQHAILTFTNQETNLSLDGGKTKDFWITISALTKDSPTRRIPLGCAPIIFFEDATPLDAPGPVQGNNLVPGGATYDGSGHYTLTGLTAGKVYSVTKGVNDTSFTNGGGAITADGDYTAAGTTFPLTGTALALVTFIIRKATYLTQDESDARYVTAGDEAAQDTAIAAAQDAADAAQADATQALADAAAAAAAAAAARSKRWPVADEDEMLALSDAKHGDIADREDDGNWYWLTSDSPSTLADWIKFPGVDYVGQWDEDTTFAARVFVKRTGSIYYSLQGNNTGHIPESSPTWWKLFMEASAIQLSDTLPAAQVVGDTGSAGTGATAMRSGARHPMPGLSTPSAPGFESAADKARFNVTETGGPNGTISCAVRVGEFTLVFGEFTTWDNVPAVRIAKIDNNGHVDPLFDSGAGVEGAAKFAVECGDGDIVFGGSAKMAYDGGSEAWLHKINLLGAVDGDFTSPTSIAATGTDSLEGLVALSDDRIAALSLRTLRVMDLTGTTLATADADGNLLGLASRGATDAKLLLTSLQPVAYDGVTVSTSVKLLDLTEDGGGAFTMAQDTDWLVGATSGGSFDAKRAVAAGDGSYYIVGNNKVSGGSFAWNGGSEVAKGLCRLNADGTQDTGFTPILVTANVFDYPQPLAIDSLGRVYFTGNITTINGTTVTPNRLYRVDDDGSNLKEFAGFDNTVTGVILVGDELICVTGNFQHYGQLPVNGIVFLDSTGVRIASLNAGSGGGGGVGDEYDYIYIDAGYALGRLTDGATADTTEKTTNYIDSDVWKFSGSAQKYIQFKFAFPDWWDLGTLKVKFHWEPATGASPGDGVVWGIRAGARGDGDAIDAALGTEELVTDVVQAVGDNHIPPVGAFTVNDSPQLGDMVWFQVTRKVGDAGDTMTQDAHLLGIHLQFKKLSTGTVLWI